MLTPADPEFHIDKSQFTVPFVCGARDLGEALRRIAEGATMIRTKGEAGTGTSHVMLSRVGLMSYLHSRCMGLGVDVMVSSTLIEPPLT